MPGCYLIRDSYFSQVEASALVNLRFGYTCMGVAVRPMRGLKRDDTPLRRRLPLFDLALWHHVGQMDVREIVRLKLLGRRVINWRTRGETTLVG